MLLRTVSTLACTVLLATTVACHAKPQPTAPSPNPAADMQMQMPADKPGQPLPSPPATAEVNLAGSALKVTYNAPSRRGRTIMGGLVPYNEVWRTGANPATTLITPVDLMIGTLKVPAGTYTLFTLPTATDWTFIVSKKAGEWGIPYPQGNDLGRTPMKSKTAGTPQEVMSLTFENTTANKTELHVRWESIDKYVTITAAK